MRAWKSPRSTSAWQRSIASLRMSAALPWMGALRATRSAAARSPQQRQAAAEQRRHHQALLGLLDGALHVVTHAGEAGEVGVDVALRHRALDADDARQTEVRLAVAQAVVHRLGDAALVGGDLGER